ncbi:integrase [Endozoicomonas montiporae]|uniref:Integrase n=2 Tax=Endozoicomonas montiporae TaxID=1027273 RepID=A0A081N0M6_9GAMM|nr:site-specific integrase [Endozoicomonas montiporae]AMO54470.1 phage integrase family protein [Endozoicomonas montiporae CL-33]KEQ11999.1 integrase [Endozoicomonas montiporae]
MFSVSMDVRKFERYALPQASDQFVMPDNRTVVSVDKDGNPVSHFGDDIWDFNAFFNRTNEIESIYQINFLPEKHNPELLLELKQRMYFLIWGAKGNLLHMEGETLRKFSNCREIQKDSNAALRVFKGVSISSFSLLSNELVFSQILHAGKMLSQKSVKNRIQCLSVLTQVNSHFPEHLRFTLGLPEGKTFEQIAKQYSTAGEGHYPTVIPVIYEQMMGRLMQEVNNAHEKLSHLRDVKAYAAQYNLTDRLAVNEFKAIEGACFMSLSAFTGMRLSELSQINVASYKEVDLDGLTLCTLRSWTRKLEKLPREDAWACAPICKKALEVLAVLNDDYRSVKGDIYFSPRFKFDGNGGGGDNFLRQLEDVILNTANLRRLFTDYSKHLDITYEPSEMDEVYRLLNPVVPARYNPMKTRENGTFYWHFSSHSLRRTFAHFVVGNGLVTLAALKHQFKHISLSMTAIYASHSEVLTLMGIENPGSVKKAVEDAEMESHRLYLKDMLDNPHEQSGGYIKSFEGDPRVMTEEQFEALAKSTKGANKSTGYGRCFAGEKCKMMHLFEPSNCVGRDCENLNINQAEAMRWQQRHKRIGERLQQMKEMGFYNRNTLARELSDIRAAEKVMTDHNITFERFELGAL